MVGERIADRYELEELVGTGGMSSVYKARDSLLERYVAIKILHERYGEDGEYVERFRHEARAVAQLSHPSIVTVIDRGDHNGRQFIVFEYVDGENLKQAVERRGPLPMREVIELGLQIARALEFAHNAGLVHRDVKPQNVLLNGDGRAKVTDFGISRSIDVKQGITQTGTVLGTSDYIAPEQARGDRVDAQTDVYSLGVVLYELLAGKPPYTGESFVAVAMRHINDPVPSVVERRPDVPLRLDLALQKAMAKESTDRFASMDELASELQACLRELGPEADSDATLIVPPAALPPPPRRRRRGGAVAVGPRARRARWPWLLLLAVALAVAAAAAAVALTRGGGSHGGTPPPGPNAPAVKLAAVAAYDPPPGDIHEHDKMLGNATDGNSSTYWETEHYADQHFGGLKSGVGFVLDAGSPRKLSRLDVVTDTPEFTAQIKASDSSTVGFEPVSDSKQVASNTTFDLHMTAPRRYYLVWITDLGSGHRQVHVNEVTGR